MTGTRPLTVAAARCGWALLLSLTVALQLRPHAQAARTPGPSIPVVINLQPIISQDEPVLDAVLIGRRLLVLDAVAVSAYEHTERGLRRIDSQSLPALGPWPRDLRGRLRTDGATWQAFLPGASCHGALEPSRVECTRDQRPWPTGFDNAGIAPGRNAFVMPGGPSYFTVAPLHPDTGANWLLAAEDGRLLFLDAARQPVASLPGASADDVAALATLCAPGSHVVASWGDEGGDGDTLRVVRVMERQLVDAATPVVLPGRLTALWTTPDGVGAMAVVRNTTTRRYEAFQIGLACGR